MKTPWKFLAELTSRRRWAKEHESSGGNDTDPAALDHEAEQTPAPPSIEVSTFANREKVPVDQVAAASDEREDSRQVAQSSAPPADGEEERKAEPRGSRHSDPGTDGPAEASVRSRRKPRLSSAERTKGSWVTVVAPSAAAPHEGQSMQSASSRDAFFDEVASLDEDIKKLRSELARKLERQNAQLKKMLKRFDIS
ncbi:hypothetical protein GGE45_001625 [Rhizobium aethiopicum]|uniref:Uncharacterized protein n=1 Tax=Rhizobium aethiopicum TaxID=1138170 RepID=A0A7W6QA92_9HYPH|nr:hypothetical protein [Rhizobium aethiopicum]MBB4193040.1 hypothetical protein [Rhizobium aethiopicum]MBB4579301.1 hypothetical protein [Rhizobium aethiopicum]